MARKFITGGTVSVSNGSTVVTGVGTAFTSVAASEFWFAGLSVLLDTVTDDEDLTLSAPWPGATLVNETAYQLWIDGEGAAVALDTNHKVRTLLEALTLKGAILYVTSAPLDSLGDDDDTAINTTPPGALYVKSGGSWSLVLASLKGDPGDSLHIDVVGLASARATYDDEAALFTFLAEDTGEIAIKRSATSADWSAWIDFQGPQGVQGDPGADGADGADGSDGAAWSDGAVPDNADGANGDFHLATSGVVYEKIAEVWTSTGIDLTGPQGATGNTGATGATGAKGDPGLSFAPDAVGVAADRSTYDGEAALFSFLATDTNQVSWKNSATPADWSAWANWGGASGATGAGSTTPLGMFVAASL